MMHMKLIGVKLYNRTGDESDFQEFDIIEDVYRIEISKKSLFSRLPYSIPDKTPIFYTRFGVFITITTLHTYSTLLKNHGFDMLNPSDLVNTNLVDCIIETPFGGDAVMKDGSVVSVSGPMIEKYSYLKRTDH